MAARTRELGTQARIDAGPHHPGGPEPDPVLSCRGLCKSIDGRVLVDDVWFDVSAGEIYGLVGPEAAGKTTILLAAGGLLDPDDTGTVLLHGRRIDSLDPATHRGWVSFMASTAVVLPSVTLLENLRFWTRFLRLPAGLRAQRVAEVCALTGLDEHLDDTADRSPAGPLRLLSLAVALLQRPHLLVLDEPLLGIDQAYGRRIRAALLRIRDRGTAVLYATRVAPQAVAVCDRVGVLERGRLVSQGKPDAIILTAA